MKLGFAERLYLMKFIEPEKEDYASWKEINRGLMVLSFTEEELTEYEIKSEPDKIVWNQKGAGYQADLPLGSWLTTHIQEKLRRENEKHELPKEHLSLYEKFIVAYDQV